MQKKWFSVVFLLSAIPVFASSGAALEETLQEKVEAARRQAYSPVVSFKLSWEWDARYVKKYSFRNRLRLNKPVEFSVPKGRVETKQTECLGVLLTNGKTVTHKNCFTAPNENQAENFVLKTLHLSFNNGKELQIPVQGIHQEGEFGYVEVPAPAIHGLPGVEVQILPPGRSLQDIYGEDFSKLKFSYALKQAGQKRSVGRRLRGNAKQLFQNAKVGMPLFWRGKLLALSGAGAEDFWEQIKNGGENFVWTVFHMNNGAGRLLQ